LHRVLFATKLRETFASGRRECYDWLTVPDGLKQADVFLNVCFYAGMCLINNHRLANIAALKIIKNGNI